MANKFKITRFRAVFIFLIFFLFMLFWFHGKILFTIGNFLIQDETPSQSDAIVVLNTGVEYYSRLIEAADLFNNAYADTIILNGNRKMDIERELEEKGYTPCCPWYENSLRVLSLYNVPRHKVISISAEDVYDSIGEAEIIGNRLKTMGYKNIIITTSKFHTKRASFIWNKLFGNNFKIYMVSAKTDPFDPNQWWKDGRQIRWVLAEYGAWIYYYWNKISE